MSRKWIHRRLTVCGTARFLSFSLAWALRDASMCFICVLGFRAEPVNIARNAGDAAPSVDIGVQHDAVGRIGGELCA